MLTYADVTYALLREAVVSASAPLTLSLRSDVRKWYAESLEETRRGREVERKRGGEGERWREREVERERAAAHSQPCFMLCCCNDVC